MPLHSTKFNPSWLEKLDPDGVPVKKWLMQGTSSSTSSCSVCKTSELCCANRGWASVERHMKNKKHCDNMQLIKENSTFIVCTEPSDRQQQQDSSSSVIPMVTLTHQNKSLNFFDQVTRAEALWAMNVARHGHSYYSCDEAGDLFKHVSRF